MAGQVFVTEYASYGIVTWYTIEYEDTGVKSVENFIERVLSEGNRPGNENVKQQLIELLVWMKDIGNSLFGVGIDSLKDERNCQALPIKAIKGLGIRLYCYWVTERIVILYNGGNKKQNNPEHCDNVRHHFYQAQSWSKQLNTIGVQNDGSKIINLEELYLNS